MEQTKVIAFHLPQYHRIPENDLWWGQGFTDWVNVKKARPLFEGHLQPRVPLERRYYDMSDPETHQWQADMARRHGIHGFCYYHYWFSGTQLLHKPLESILSSGQPDFPLCLAWANEPWTRSWDGRNKNVLMPQSYGARSDWKKHFEYLSKVFSDRRYIKIDGKPVFLIYRPKEIADLPQMLALWRKLALSQGFPGLHIIGMLTGHEPDLRRRLFDAYAEFEPMYTVHHYRHQKPESRWSRTITRLHRSFAKRTGRPIPPRHRDASPYTSRPNYQTVWDEIVRRPIVSGHYPGAFADWDNSPRRPEDLALIFTDFKSETFKQSFAKQYQKGCTTGSPFMFVNAWNEWAEGTYLEPDEARGHFFLEAIRDAVEGVSQQGDQGR